MPYAYGADEVEFVVLNDFYRQFVGSRTWPRAIIMGEQEQKLSKAQNLHTTHKNVPNM